MKMNIVIKTVCTVVLIFTVIVASFIAGRLTVQQPTVSPYPPYIIVDDIKQLIHFPGCSEINNIPTTKLKIVWQSAEVSRFENYCAQRFEGVHFCPKCVYAFLEEHS